MLGMRRAYKKGRLVITKKGTIVRKLAQEIKILIRPYCRRIELAGSIRRGVVNPVDIDIVLIPKSATSKDEILTLLRKEGKFMSGGDRRTTFRIEGIKVELYYADETNFGAMLLSYTGSSGYQIGLRIIARKKNLLLNQYGLFERKTKKRIAGKTEKSIYKKLQKIYKRPQDRV